MGSVYGEICYNKFMANGPASISDEAILKATGAPWTHWLEVFSLMDAKSLPHKDIARKLSEDHKVPGWWSQMLTVKFEYEIGRRQIRQDKPGEYTMNFSSTIHGHLDIIYKRWQHAHNTIKELNGVAFLEAPVLSQTDNWRYWKAKMSDGSRIYINFSQKSEEKVLLQITQERISSEAKADQWKEYWKYVVHKEFS